MRNVLMMLKMGEILMMLCHAVAFAEVDQQAEKCTFHYISYADYELLNELYNSRTGTGIRSHPHAHGHGRA